MSHGTAEFDASSKDVKATLNYVGSVAGGGRALYDIRNPADTNIVWDPREVTIYDVRPHLKSIAMDSAGFAFIKHQSAVAEDPALFQGNLQERHFASAGLSAEYEAELCSLVKELTGAREVFPRLGGLVIRTSKRAEKRGWAPPAEFVHLDFAPHAMPMWLNLTLQQQERQLSPYRRMALFQAWRTVSPGPQDSTLAICDGSSVSPSDGLVVDSMTGPAGTPGSRWDSRMSHYSPSHRWYYMPDMEPDDLILFKGFDSDAPDAMNAMHSAFSNPLGQNGVPRRSMEARLIAIYD
jgi:hypothetical protein